MHRQTITDTKTKTKTLTPQPPTPPHTPKVVLFGYLLIFFFEKVAFDSSGLVAVNEKETDNENENENENDKENDNEDEQLNTQAQSADNCNTKGHSKTTRSAVILLGALAVHSVLEVSFEKDENASHILKPTLFQLNFILLGADDGARPCRHFLRLGPPLAFDSSTPAGRVHCIARR